MMKMKNGGAFCSQEIKNELLFSSQVNKEDSSQPVMTHQKTCQHKLALIKTIM